MTDMNKTARLGTGTLEDPIIDNIGYLDNEGKWHQVGGSGGGGDIPTATDAEEGKVLLSDTADESKDAATGGTAATPKAVYDAMKNAVANATDVVIGKVKLTDDYNQDLPAATGVTAVTPNAVQAALQEAKDYTDERGYIVKPVITSPSHNATGVSPQVTVVATTFRSVFEDDTRKHREFRIASDPKFSSIVASKDVDADQWEVESPLNDTTTYYAKVRDIANSGYESAWSDTVKFTTGVGVIIDTPTITLHGIDDSPTDIGSGVRITTSAFNVSTGKDTHKATSWSIAATSGRLRANVWESLNDTTHKTEITVPDDTFQKGTSYTLTVIYHGDSGTDSSPATKTFITTSDFGMVLPPTVSVTGEPNQVFETPTISGGAFSNTRDPDTHQSSEWKIEPAAGGEPVFSKTTPGAVTSTTVEAGKLQPGTAYKAFARYQGTKYGWSEWGEKQFTTVDQFAGVKTPTLTLKNCEPDSVNSDFVFVASILEYIGGEDTCDKADWQLMKGGEKVWSAENSNAIISIGSFGSYTLLKSTSYTLRYRHHAKTHDEWSDWVELQFTTEASYTEATLKFTMKNKINLSKIFKWWNASQLEVYKNGELQADWSSGYTEDRSLSSEGDRIEIRNKSSNNYPYVIFNGTEAEYDSLKLGANLISVDAPLPLLRKTDNGDAATDFGGDAGDTCSKGRGMCWKTSYLKSVPSGMFKNNPQIVNFGGMGGGGGGGAGGKENGTGLGGAGGAGGGAGSGAGGAADSSDRAGGKGLGGYGCFAYSGIETLPEGLFSGCANAINFGGWGGGGGGGGGGAPGYTYPGGRGGYGGDGHGCFAHSKVVTLPEGLFTDCTSAAYFGGMSGGNGGSGGATGNASAGSGGTGLGGTGYGCFAYAEQLKSVPENIFFGCINVIHFDGAGNFNRRGYGCFSYSGIETLPEGLFRDCRNVTNFVGYGNPDDQQKGNQSPDYEFSGGGGGGGCGWYCGGGGGGGGYKNLKGGNGGDGGANDTKNQGQPGRRVGGGGGGGGGGGSFGGNGGAGGSGSIALGGAGGELIATTPDYTWQYCFGVFSYCPLTSVPIDIFKPLDKLIVLLQPFLACSKLTVKVRLSATEIADGMIEGFATQSKGKGTVYVPAGSQTANAFKAATNANVIVVEE